ncbi:glycosyltransferase family 2 protein [Aestuariivivens marinum]|uniref:glycosyltransferase family 2 protein n=1 Tax=Aestuariivivens marinum TaxID=2913555 RepID=UPI001F575AF0|nr:glycosyltransferase [Aestuariivivens marinum]
MNLKLSIVIPCYNMGNFVKEAIASAQDYPQQNAIELIVVNDGSNDNGYTKTILDSYTNRNISIIHQDNKGLGAARNTGLAAAQAPYVLLLDADNKIRPNYITTGCAVLDNNPNVGLVYSDLERFGESQGVVRIGDFDAARLLKKNYIDACAVLRKSAWESIHGYDEHMPIMGYEDWDLNLRLFFKGWQFHYIDTVCFDYRVRLGSMLETSNKNRNLLCDYMFAKPELKQAKLLRERLLNEESVTEELSKLKQRKAISGALKVEHGIKKNKWLHQIFKRIAKLLYK